MFEDVLYSFQLLWYSQRVMCTTDIGYIKRIHSNSICGRPENIFNVVSLWKTYKKMVSLCGKYELLNDNCEYVCLKMIEKSINQFVRHYRRLPALEKEEFLNSLSRWDRVRFNLLGQITSN